MSDIRTPQDADWNRFWEKDASKRFGRISWSKRRILRVLKPYLQESKTALDAGCGSGFFAGAFVEHGLQATAVDYSEKALAMARDNTRGKAAVARINLVDENLRDLLDTRFDLIFTDGLFEHFSPTDQDRILQNFRSVIKENGVICTFVPNRFSPWEIIRPFYVPGIEEKPFVLKELIKLHTRNGLEVVAQGGINTLPFWFSPDHLTGSLWGMLLYVITRNA